MFRPIAREQKDLMDYKGVYIQQDNHDKENIEDQDNIEKISSEESVNSQELEETPQKRSVSLNVYRVRWTMRRDGVLT